MTDRTISSQPVQGRVVYFNPKGMAVEVPAEMCERILAWGDAVAFPEPCLCGSGPLVKFCDTSKAHYFCDGRCK